VEDLMKPFEFKLMYVSRQANDCLVKGSSVKDCQVKSAKLVKDVVESILKSVEKI
jgi:hypothetical protein